VEILAILGFRKELARADAVACGRAARLTPERETCLSKRRERQPVAMGYQRGIDCKCSG
jgi:hypothetical protein